MRLAVFASGSGSNFDAIVNAARAGELDIEVVLCMANRGTAGVLDRAHAAGVPTLVLRPEDFATEDEYTGRLNAALDDYDVNFVALAGYLKKIPSGIVQRFRHRIVNIHPALLPAFGGTGMYGRRVHEAVLEYGVRWTGVTVHLVDEDYDTGPIVVQVPVPVEPDDTVESLADRVLKAEHRTYPVALQMFATGRVKISGRHVFIEPPSSESR